MFGGVSVNMKDYSFQNFSDIFPGLALISPLKLCYPVLTGYVHLTSHKWGVFLDIQSFTIENKNYSRTSKNTSILKYTAVFRNSLCLPMPPGQSKSKVWERGAKRSVSSRLLPQLPFVVFCNEKSSRSPASQREISSGFFSQKFCFWTCWHLLCQTLTSVCTKKISTAHRKKIPLPSTPLYYVCFPVKSWSC